MASNPNPKGFKQISLPSDLVDEITKAAELADRSVPKQIEHSFKIARAIEQVLPEGMINAIKTTPVSGPEVLQGLVNTLVNPDYSAAIAKNGHRISVDPSDASKHIKTYPDGHKERGCLTPLGEFVPQEILDTNKQWTPLLNVSRKTKIDRRRKP